MRKGQIMAKTEKSKLEAATEELRKAEQKYEGLIGRKIQNKSKVSEKDCQDALLAKRETKKVVDAIRQGLPVPKKRDEGRGTRDE